MPFVMIPTLRKKKKGKFYKTYSWIITGGDIGLIGEHLLYGTLVSLA